MLDLGASAVLGFVSALGLAAATTSSPAAKPNAPDLFTAGAAGLVSALVSTFASGFASGAGAAATLGASLAGSTGTSALGFSSALGSVPGIGKLVTMFTAMSLDDAFGLLSKIRGKPITAINTRTAAPIRRWRALCCSGSSVRASSSASAAR